MPTLPTSLVGGETLLKKTTEKSWYQLILTSLLDLASLLAFVSYGSQPRTSSQLFSVPPKLVLCFLFRCSGFFLGHAFRCSGFFGHVFLCLFVRQVFVDYHTKGWKVDQIMNRPPKSK